MQTALSTIKSMNLMNEEDVQIVVESITANQSKAELVINVHYKNEVIWDFVF